MTISSELGADQTWTPCFSLDILLPSAMLHRGDVGDAFTRHTLKRSISVREFDVDPTRHSPFLAFSLIIHPNRTEDSKRIKPK